jgi:chemotaxis protein MotB
MFHRDRRSEESNNFWVSYADLMAGLLFVFILLIGAIVSKSIILRENLHKKEARLEATRTELQHKERNLRKTKERLAKLERELRRQQEALESGKREIRKQDSVISRQKEHIAAAEEKIRLQEEEVRKLHLLLEDLKLQLARERKRGSALNAAAADLNRTLSRERKALAEARAALRDREALITLSRKDLKLRQSELERLNQLLLARNAKIDELNRKVVILQNLTEESNTTITEKQKKLQEYVNKVIVLSGKLTRAKNELRLRDENLTRLLTALDRQKTRYDDLIRRLQKQRAQIKSLTGIRLKVIAALKETLGRKIDIDKKTGALRLSSNILFDRGSAELREEAKAELRDSFEKYIAALLSNRAIRPHLDRIIIEGHTDSDGGYLYNLELSQKRALAVMNYLLSLPIARKYHLKKYLVASGRAYMDRIVRNGVEDKEASRRIEIKFTLRNREAMYEIERILDEGKSKGQLF